MSTIAEQKKLLAACQAHLLPPTGRVNETPELLILKHHGSGLAVQPLPVPEGLWNPCAPLGAIETVTEVILALGVTATDIAAVALEYDAFAMTPESSPQAAEAIRRHKAGGSIPQARNIPGSVRQKCISAVDRHVRHYHAFADRLGDGTTSPTVNTAITEPGEAGGELATALDALARAVWPRPEKSAAVARSDRS